MSKNITCPHCHASRTNLHVITEFAHGARARAIQCLRCGYRIPEAKRTAMPHIPPARKAKIGTVKKITTPRVFIPCTACGEISVWKDHTKTGLCKKCGARLRSWQQNGKTMPPPFIRYEDRWINNPARQNQQQQTKRA